VTRRQLCAIEQYTRDVFLLVAHSQVTHDLSLDLRAPYVVVSYIETGRR